MTLVVVKVGGSLALHPDKLRELCKKLSYIAMSKKLLVVPGGGEFADTVRRLDDRFSLSCDVSHHMAILGMDQYGLLLSDLTPNSVTINDLNEARKSFDVGQLPIFLPSKMLFGERELENSWEVTSDAIALYVAQRLQASKVVLITDVDGIYDADPKQYSNAKLLQEVRAAELLERKKRTSVDLFLPKLILQFPVDCFVVNGLVAKRVSAVINGQDAVCTVIKGS